MHPNTYHSTVFQARLIARARLVGGRLNGDGSACARKTIVLGLGIELTS